MSKLKPSHIFWLALFAILGARFGWVLADGIEYAIEWLFSPTKVRF